MKYKILFFTVCLYLPLLACGQANDLLNRKPEIERFTEKTFSMKEFWLIVDSIQLTIDELCDYPVIFPIKKPQRISSGFGMRYHPVYKVRKFHRGIDIPKAKGTPVHATGNGIVVRKGYSSGYGNFIEIEHTGGFCSFYAHLSKTLVNVGDSINITQQIGYVGNTGVVTGSHLHYEIRKGNRFLNPIEWCGCLFKIWYKQNLKEQKA